MLDLLLILRCLLWVSQGAWVQLRCFKASTGLYEILASVLELQQTLLIHCPKLLLILPLVEHLLLLTGIWLICVHSSICRQSRILFIKLITYFEFPTLLLINELITNYNYQRRFFVLNYQDYNEKSSTINKTLTWRCPKIPSKRINSLDDLQEVKAGNQV